jgi:hypothetical protein
LYTCFVKHHASNMGEEWTCTSISSYCVYVDRRKRLVICPSSVYPLGNIFCYRLNSRFGGPQSRSRHHGEETISSPAGNRIPFPSLLLATTIQNCLQWLRTVVSSEKVQLPDVLLIAMTARCCGCWLARIVGSKPTGDVEVCLL